MLTEYRLSNSTPECRVKVLSMSDFWVHIIYPDFRSSLISRKDFDTFYEEVK